MSSDSTSNSSSNGSSSSSSDSSTSSSDVDVSKFDAHFDSGQPLDGKFRKPLDKEIVETPDEVSVEPSGEEMNKASSRKFRTAESTPSTLDWGKIKQFLSNPQAKKVLVHVPEPTDRINLAPLDSTGFYSKALSLGVGLPVHHFFISVLNSYKIAPAQLNPFAWCHMMGIFFIWSDLGFGEPSLNVWRHLYKIYPIKHHPQFYYFSGGRRGERH